ncbi:Aminotransferase, class IV, conserved site [Phytophthora cactorum]|nr:Aminotransferase, class IV, conserved site [Phytophthora cactorum]
MGGAVSIDNTPYDETKFLQSKAIMESAADDAEKFSKLKSIWTDGAPPDAADGHHKSVKEPEVGAAYEEHKEEAHKVETHNGEVHKDEHHEKHHCHKEEHHHREGDSHHKESDNHHKEGDHHAHREEEHHHKVENHQEEGEHHEHKRGEDHKEGDHVHKVESHAAKEDGHAEAPKDSPKAPSGSASTGKLPSASSEHLSEKVSKEVCLRISHPSLHLAKFFTLQTSIYSLSPLSIPFICHRCNVSFPSSPPRAQAPPVMIARGAKTLGRMTSSRAAAFSTGADISFANLQVERTSNPKPKLPKEQLKFGKTFTDHMLEVDWELGKGWGHPVIHPYGPMAIDPASAVLHYALECFEGMKAYVDAEGHIRLFRPDMNMKRLNNSMKRLLLPEFDGDEFTKCLEELIRLDQDWVPKGEGYSLYIRPTGISTQASIGVGASEKAKLFIILSPYDAQEQGYSQNLWIFGPDHDITEVGTMNLFIHWINEQGEKELITPPLTRGDILPGITRDSILHLTREWNEFKVTEGNITMKQVQKASKEGRIIEIFGSGTAAVVSPVSTINYMDEDLAIPLDGTDGKAGKVAERIWNELSTSSTAVASTRGRSLWTKLRALAENVSRY